MLLYLLFGKSESHRQSVQIRSGSGKSSRGRMKETFEELKEQGECSSSVRYIHQYSAFQFMAIPNNKYFQVGDDMFPVLVRGLGRHSIIFILVFYHQ